MRPKLTIVRDAETAPILDAAKRAAAEVASWPAWKRGEPEPARIVKEAERGRVWHSVLRDRTVTIVTHCGTEMPRGCWLQTEDESIKANCKRCGRERDRRERLAGRPPSYTDRGEETQGMSEPEIIEEIPARAGGTWRFTRWSYDGAPLVAERCPKGLRHLDAYTVEIDEAGDLEISASHGAPLPTIPGEVLQRLVNDALARGVLAVPRNEENRLAKVLHEIAYDPHCAYPEPHEPSTSLADSQYKIGVADGHRCAAQKARDALAALPGRGRE